MRVTHIFILFDQPKQNTNEAKKTKTNMHTQNEQNNPLYIYISSPTCSILTLLSYSTWRKEKVTCGNKEKVTCGNKEKMTCGNKARGNKLISDFVISVISSDFKWFQMISGDFKWFRISVNKLISDREITRSHMKSMKSLEITRNHSKSPKSRKSPEITKITWNHLKSPEITWNQFKSI